MTLLCDGWILPFFFFEVALVSRTQFAKRVFLLSQLGIQGQLIPMRLPDLLKSSTCGSGVSAATSTTSTTRPCDASTTVTSISISSDNSTTALCYPNLVTAGDTIDVESNMYLKNISFFMLSNVTVSFEFALKC